MGDCHELSGDANRTSIRKIGDMRNMEYMESKRKIGDMRNQRTNSKRKVKILYYLHQTVTWAPRQMNNLFSEDLITPTATKNEIHKLSNNIIQA